MIVAGASASTSENADVSLVDDQVLSDKDNEADSESVDGDISFFLYDFSDEEDEKDDIIDGITSGDKNINDGNSSNDVQTLLKEKENPKTGYFVSCVLLGGIFYAGVLQYLVARKKKRFLSFNCC